jgi:1,4-dihydroxy-2-naphthoate octaprenyltransferase
MKKKLKNWIVELRAPFLTATVVSIILGTAIAWTRNNVFNPGYFLLALVGGVFAHLGTNVANDYFDHRSGNDEVNKEFVRPFSGGSRTIQQGLLTPKEVLSGAVLFFAVATLIGAYLAWATGPLVLVLVAVGLISGFFYTAPPFNWVSKGIGETLVGINFGALMTLGAYYVQTQKAAIEPVIASIPVSLLIAAVLYINEFPDYVADKTVGKNTVVVRLGRNKAVYGYVLIVLGAYISIFLSALAGITPLYTLVALIPLPLAIESIRHASIFHSESSSLVPANAMTILIHLFTSLLISFGYLGQSFETLSTGYVIIMSLIAVCTVFLAYFYLKIENAKKRASVSLRSPSQYVGRK